MTAVEDIPHAEMLQVVVSENGKHVALAFTVKGKPVLVSMDASNFLKSFDYLFSALNSPALSKLRAPDLPKYGLHESPVTLEVRQVLASITPLGEDITLSVELPGAVLVGLRFPKAEIPRLQTAVEAAVQLCESQQSLTKQ